MRPDDPTIEADEILYRYSPSIPHQNWTVTDQATKQISIALAALQWDDDGISCYRERILHENGLDWRAVKREPRNGVFFLRVQDIRAELLGVAFDPNPESGDGHPRDAAHSLIVDCGLPKRSNKGCAATARCGCQHNPLRQR